MCNRAGFLLYSGKYQGLFGLTMGTLARPTVDKPWLDQTNSPWYFPESSKTLYDYIQKAGMNLQLD